MRAWCRWSALTIVRLFVQNCAAIRSDTSLEEEGPGPTGGEGLSDDQRNRSTAQPPSGSWGGQGYPDDEKLMSAGMCDPAQYPSFESLVEIVSKPANSKPWDPLHVLNRWCSELHEHVREEHTMFSCEVCVDTCTNGHQPIWLHWTDDEGELFIGNEEGWQYSAWSGSPNTCFHSKHTESANTLKAVGAYNKPEGACAGFSMTIIARWHARLLSALGIKTMQARDDSFFVNQEFKTLPLLASAHGTTFYKKVYREGFRFLDESCAEELQGIAKEAKAVGTDATAMGVLGLLRQARLTKSKEGLDQARQLHNAVADAPAVRSFVKQCDSFEVVIDAVPVTCL